jgi:hypothetical protein
MFDHLQVRLGVEFFQQVDRRAGCLRVETPSTPTHYAPCNDTLMRQCLAALSDFVERLGTPVCYSSHPSLLLLLHQSVTLQRA